MTIDCVTECVNGGCSDLGVPRSVAISDSEGTPIGGWICGTCGSRMQPPACANPELLNAWTVETGLEIEDYGACAGQYHAPDASPIIEGPPE